MPTLKPDEEEPGPLDSQSRPQRQQQRQQQQQRSEERQQQQSAQRRGMEEEPPERPEPLNTPPDGFFPTDEVKSRSCRNANYKTPSYVKFVDMIAQQNLHPDVDRIYCTGPPIILRTLCGSSTIECGGRDYSNSTPKGHCFLSKGIYILKSDKKSVLEACAHVEDGDGPFDRKSFSHFRLIGANDDRELFLQSHTFLVRDLVKLLEVANVKKVRYVSYGMKGNLHWAHQTIKDIMAKVEDVRSNCNISIDFAVSIDPQFCHYSKEGTHQCKAGDLDNRAKQCIPLALVDQREVRKAFGGSTAVHHFPIFVDSQMVAYPNRGDTLRGGFTIQPKLSREDHNQDEAELEANDDELEANDDELEANNDDEDSFHTELAEVSRVKGYWNGIHAMKEWLRVTGKDLLDGCKNVKQATIRLNALGKGMQNMVCGGVNHQFRLEATVDIPFWVVFNDYTKDDGSEIDPDNVDTSVLPMSLLEQFHFAMWPIWKIFHCCNICLLPQAIVASSAVRMLMLLNEGAINGQLPSNAHCYSGSNDPKQVGQKWSKVELKRILVQMLLPGEENVLDGSQSFYGKNGLSFIEKFMGKCQSTPHSPVRRRDHNGHDDDSVDDDPDWVPNNRDPEPNHADEIIADNIAGTPGGRLSRELTEDQKVIAGIIAGNLGWANIRYSFVLSQHFRQEDELGGAPRNNAFLWVTYQAFLLLVRTMLDENCGMQNNQIRQCIEQFFPNPVRNAEIGENEAMGQYLCLPPQLPNNGTPMPYTFFMTGGFGTWRNSIHISERYSNTNQCFNGDQFATSILLVLTGRCQMITMFPCPYSQHLPRSRDRSRSSQNNNVPLDKELLKDLKRWLKVSTNKDGMNFSHNKLGARFQGAGNVDDLFKLVAQKISSGQQPVRNKYTKAMELISAENWKSLLSTVVNAREINDDDNDQQAGETPSASLVPSQNDRDVTKLKLLLMNFLQIHTIEGNNGPNLFWAQMCVGGNEIFVETSKGEVINAAADKILQTDSTYLNNDSWFLILETNTSCPGYEAERHEDLTTSILEGARFFHGSVGPTRYYYLRYSPTCAGGSWKYPVAIGHTKQDCAKNASVRLLESTGLQPLNSILLMERHNIAYINDEYWESSVFGHITDHSDDQSTDNNGDAGRNSMVCKPSESHFDNLFLNGEWILHIFDHNGITTQFVWEEKEDEEMEVESNLDNYDIIIEETRGVDVESEERIDAGRRENEENNEDVELEGSASTPQDQFSPPASPDETPTVVGTTQGSQTPMCETNQNQNQNEWDWLASADWLNISETDGMSILPIKGHQGKHVGDVARDSTDGCCVITYQVLQHYFKNEYFPDENQLVQIMDVHAPPIIRQIRVSREEEGRIGIFEVTSTLGTDGFKLSDTYYGNILDPTYRKKFYYNCLDKMNHPCIDNIQSARMQKVGVSFYFGEHTISMCKYGRSGFWYVFESVARLSTPTQTQQASLVITLESDELMDVFLSRYANYKLEGKESLLQEAYPDGDLDGMQQDIRTFEAAIFVGDSEIHRFLHRVNKKIDLI